MPASDQGTLPDSAPSVDDGSPAAPRHPTLCVINADDFGRSSTVNQAILDSFERGLVTSATIMANMPGFGEAGALAHDKGVQDRIGVHLNLTEGRPITDPIRLCPRLCDADGNLLHRPGTIWRLSPDEARAVEVELAAQIEAVLSAGIRPSHLDSHHHIHTHWPICTVVMRLARRHDIPAIRLSRNCGVEPGLLKRWYKVAFNRRLSRAGFGRTDRFGSTRDAALIAQPVRALEIMVHPDIDREGRLVDVTSDAGPLEDAVRGRRPGTRLVSYRELSNPDLFER